MRKRNDITPKIPNSRLATVALGKAGYFKAATATKAKSPSGYHDPAAERVTGSLHMGICFPAFIMDTMIRYQRMQGKTPGRSAPTTLGSHPDGIERKIAAEEGKTRHDYGRDAFIDKSGSGKRNPAAPLPVRCAVSATC